jgi:hypothetical protein
MKPKKPALNNAAEARRKAESAALFQASGKFKTGAHNPEPKRARTRGASESKAIEDFNK